MEEKFLKVLSECGNVSAAIQAANVARPTVYAHKQNDPAFAQEWADALDRAADVLEEEAWRRGYEGIEEPIFGNLGGGQGHRRDWPDAAVFGYVVDFFVERGEAAQIPR
jgi:hypothetical protein